MVDLTDKPEIEQKQNQRKLHLPMSSENLLTGDVEEMNLELLGPHGLMQNTRDEFIV